VRLLNKRCAEEPRYGLRLRSGIVEGPKVSCGLTRVEISRVRVAVEKR